MTTLPDCQVPGLHHCKLGDILVTAVSDGFLRGSMTVLQNITEADSSAMLRAAFRPAPRHTSLNCFLIRSGGRTALIDTGAGTHMQASAGKLLQNLEAADVAPAAIDTVLLTHMHPDHANGLADAAGSAFFPAAELAMHEAEYAYWCEDQAAEATVTASGRGAPYFAMARSQAAPYRDRLKLFQGGEVFPGVTALHFPGHTPGHSGFLVASGSESLLIWGDIVHVPEVQVPRPEVTMQYDVDPVQAEATRRRVFDMVATDGQHIAGMHLHFPGLAHLARESGGYRLHPDAWRFEI